MHLKTLDIYGFKSFANKIELSFEPGITCIVGPNGSGKSNIADSIKWVLGEQSAKLLRGSKMEDVIFAGSHGKKPLGFAEVSLTLDNSDGGLPIDFAEVTITRKVFRSGESEYYINKAPCRLRDINELFMETGIGKESYAIIEQGKIDSVLSSHPQERRRLLEEVAGISKYRVKRAEATKRLDAAHQDLLRISDIIREVEGELQPLEVEAEKARSYLELKEELKTVEVSIYGKRLSALEGYLEVCEDEIRGLMWEYQEAEGNLIKAEGELDLAREAVKSRQIALTQIEGALRDISNEVSTLHRTCELAKGKIDGVKEQKDMLSKRKAELEMRLTLALSQNSDGAKRLSQATAELKQKRDQVTRYEEALKDYRTRFEVALEGVERSKTHMIDLLNEIAEKRNFIARSEAEMEGLLREYMRLQGDVQEWKVKGQEGQAELKALLGRIDELEEGIGVATEGLNELKGVKDDLEAQLSGKRSKLEELRGDLNLTTSKLKVFTNLKETHEGYMKGVQAILRMASSDPKFVGILGTVADLLKVESRYEVAMEAALGSRVQYLVAEGEKDVELAIDYLKRTRKGRATFLPLTLVRPSYLRRAEEGILKRRGVLGTANSFVTFEPKYSDVVMSLLGRVVLVETLRDAMEVAKEFTSLRLVTLDGDIINPGGIITGGSRQEREESGLLSRNRIIYDLQEERLGLMKDIESIQLEMGSLEAEHGKVTCDMAGLRDQIHKDEFTLGEIRKRYEEMTLSLGSLASRERTLQMEMADRKETMEVLKGKVVKTRDELETLLCKRKQLEEGVGAAQQGNLLLEGEVKRLSEEVIESRVNLASMEEKAKALKDEVERLQAVCSGLKEEMRGLEAEYNALSQREALLEEEIRFSQSRISQLDGSCMEKESAIDRLSSEREEAMANLKKAEEESRSLRNLMGRLKERLHSREILKSRLTMERDNAWSKLHEEYDILLQDLSREPVSSKDLEKLDLSTLDDPFSLLRASNLREKMKALEPVSLGSIGIYGARLERYNFLKNQHKDLLEARDSLIGVIEKIDKTIKERFKETYGVVRGHFQEIFKKIFQGGQADLLLEDETDLLQSGIDIVAQPPGKKLQHLSLLSGGERALTGIAFIFALMATKPSPFCILDEIDASLDEANVERFTHLLKEFSSDMQFIVVTHRRLTMETADVIYGVTMEQTGVSKVIATRFDDVLNSSPDFTKE